jgi:hypothetical protein
MVLKKTTNTPQTILTVLGWLGSRRVTVILFWRKRCTLQQLSKVFIWRAVWIDYTKIALTTTKEKAELFQVFPQVINRK